MNIATQTKQVSEEVKYSDPGFLVGYAATWDEDSTGERFQKGAFAKSLNENKGKIPLMVRHASNDGEVEDVVGVVTHAIEDDYGLLMWGKWGEDEKSNQVRKQVVSGLIDGLSVGYETIKRDETVIKEARWLETTITVKPANTRARILDAKSSDKPDSLERQAESTRKAIRMKARLLELNSEIK